MRNILVDHARKLHAGKRGGGVTPVIVDAQIDQTGSEVGRAGD